MSVLTYLETFSAVIEAGSFTAAAEALGISKSVVSKQVSQLEKHLGVQLLNRTTRRLHLTQAGEVFASYTRRIMSEVHDAEQSVLPLHKEPQGILRLSAPESLASSLLPEAILQFQQKYPKLELDVHITGRYVDLVEEGIDVGLRVGELEDSSLIARLLTPCRFHICASPKYLRQQGRPEHPEDLESHNCLIYSQIHRPDGWHFRDTNGKEFTVKVSGNLRSDTGSLLMQAAINGNGLFVGPTYMVADAIQDARLETILEQYTPASIGLYAVYPYSKLVSTKVRAFVDFLVETWGD